MILCEYLKWVLHIIEHILCWIEDHPVFVGVAVPMIVGVFGVRKYLKSKRLEACFSLYASLKLQIKYLKVLLDEKNMLNTQEPKSGNIYALLYDVNILSTVCPAFHIPESEYLCEIADCCKKIQNTLMNSTCNINPNSVSRYDWDQHLQTIYNFCEFIRTYQKKVLTKITKEEDLKDLNSNYKHVLLCNNFNDALESVVNAIDNIYEKFSND